MAISEEMIEFCDKCLKKIRADDPETHYFEGKTYCYTCWVLE